MQNIQDILKRYQINRKLEAKWLNSSLTIMIEKAQNNNNTKEIDSLVSLQNTIMCSVND